MPMCFGGYITRFAVSTGATGWSTDDTFSERGSVVSLRFICTNPPQDEKTISATHQYKHDVNIEVRNERMKADSN